MIPAAAMGYALLAFRCTAMFLVAPVVSARPVPARLRLALALAVTLIAGSALDPAVMSVRFEGSALVAAIFGECFIGLAAGTSARAFFEAASAAGQTMGLSAGLGLGSVLDPLSGASTTAVGDLLGVVAAATAVALGLHLDVVTWVCVSAREHPPGTLGGPWLLVDAAIESSTAAIALAARLCIPVVGAILTAHIVVGMIGRAVPQMSLHNVGFAIPLVVGGAVLFDGALDASVLVIRAAQDALAGGS